MSAPLHVSRLSAAAVPAASIGSNVFSYALLLTAAHVLSRSDYGQLSSLLGLLLIATVPMFALQTVAARRVAAAGAPGEGPAGLVRGTLRVGLAAAGLLAVASPAVAWFLHLDSPAGPLLVAATVPAMAVLGTAQGLAQGRREFSRLAVLIVAAIGGRSVGGLLLLVAGQTPLWTLTGVLLGTGLAAAAVLGRDGAVRAVAGRHRVGPGLLGETLNAAHAHGAFLLLTSLDVLLARHVLSSDDAGRYAVGSVITRASLWLPQSVALLLFASLADPARHRVAARRATAAVCALGGVMVAATALFGGLAVTMVGGTKYRDLNSIAWLFALLGGLLALVQLAIMAGLARRRARRTSILWLTAAADVIVVLATQDDATPLRLVVTLVAIASCAAAASVVLTLGAGQRGQLEPDGQPPAV